VTIAALAGSVLLAGMGLGWAFWKAGVGAASRDRRAVDWPRSPWKNARPDVAYVGDAACIRCHPDIAATFRSHPMGRSLAPIAEATLGETPDGSTTFEANGSRFTVERQGGRMVHREARIDDKGRVLAQVEAVVKYALGSGARAVSYLVERDGRLFESPITWYSRDRRWNLSPGYEGANNRHFDRPIEPGCLFCHANRVEPVAWSVNRYAEPTFRGHAIGCERCHGPGELHARRPEMAQGRDPTIVNPQHLESALRLAVCEQCHAPGMHRVERSGRSLFDYRPGLPTVAFFAIYGRADQAGNNAVDQVEQMKASRCFRESRGGLDCTSCHDPHQLPEPGEKVEYFRNRCLACHWQKNCSLPEPARVARSSEDDCIQCHMPGTKSADIAHVTITDHRIPRAPGTAPVGAPQPTPDFPSVLLNGDGLGPEELRSLERELAIAVVGDGPRMPDTPRVRQIRSFAMGVLDGVLAHRPDDLVARRWKAMALSQMGRRAEAIREVEVVLRAAPSYERALDECLSYAIPARDVRTALEAARRAVAIDPSSAAFHERLAYASVQGRDWDTALRESRAALGIDPFLRFARMFLIQGLLHRGEAGPAREEFATLIGLYPGLRESLERWFADEQNRLATGIGPGVQS
jgi:predicted CXXCH cytochrome family protein